MAAKFVEKCLKASRFKPVRKAKGSKFLSHREKAAMGIKPRPYRARDNKMPLYGVVGLSLSLIVFVLLCIWQFGTERGILPTHMELIEKWTAEPEVEKPYFSPKPYIAPKE